MSERLTLIDDFQPSAPLTFRDDFGMPIAEFNLSDEPANLVDLSRNRRRALAAVLRVAARDVFAAIQFDSGGGWIEV